MRRWSWSAEGCLVLFLTFTAMEGQALPAVPKPAPVDEYPIHADGGLIYDPERREAEKTGQLIRYLEVPRAEREPIIASQTMADMRANVQIGPFPERHIRERLREMADHGIDVVATTAMPWLYDDMRRPASNYQGDAFKYVLDVARLDGMAVEGWGAYPFDRADVQSTAAWITGQPIGITEYSREGAAISHADPMLPSANVAALVGDEKISPEEFGEIQRLLALKKRRPG